MKTINLQISYVTEIRKNYTIHLTDHLSTLAITIIKTSIIIKTFTNQIIFEKIKCNKQSHLFENYYIYKNKLKCILFFE